MAAEPLAADPADAPGARVDPKTANIVYHDWEATHYDDKWSISYDRRCIDYALGRFRRAVPGWDGEPYGPVLEIGCGTGFFSLNLAQAGVVEDVHVTDISQGMVDVCVRNGRRLGLDVTGQQADAEALPFGDAAFDLVLGHAVVHHLPDLDAAFGEVRRVLKPGGRLVVAGEPTLLGDAVANQWKRATRLALRTAAALVGRERLLRPPMAAVPEDERAAAALEAHVDQHIFTPAELERLAVRAGFRDVRVVTEELTANWFGWVTRTAEAMLQPHLVGDRYRFAAYRTWQTLFWLDDRVLRRVVPRDLSYNAILTATA